MFWLLAGAALSLGGRILQRSQQRKQARKEAEYQKAQAKLQAETQRGNLSNELIAAKTQDYDAAGGLAREAREGSIRANKGLFEAQRTGEEAYMGLVSQGAAASADLGAQSALTGAEEDDTLRTIMEKGIRQQMTSGRRQLDTQRDLGTWTNMNEMGKMLESSEALRSKYNEGGQAMRVHDFQLGQINKGETLTTSYLDKVIKDNKYNAGWFMADLLDFGAAGAGAIGSGMQLGMIDPNGAMANPFRKRTQFTGVNYNMFGGANYRTGSNV